MVEHQVPLLPGKNSEAHLCFRVVADLSERSFVQAPSASKARRDRRFRVAFLLGIRCVQLGPPGLTGIAVEANGREKSGKARGGGAPNVSVKPVQPVDLENPTPWTHGVGPVQPGDLGTSTDRTHGSNENPVQPDLGTTTDRTHGSNENPVQPGDLGTPTDRTHGTRPVQPGVLGTPTSGTHGKCNGAPASPNSSAPEELTIGSKSDTASNALGASEATGSSPASVCDDGDPMPAMPEVYGPESLAKVASCTVADHTLVTEAQVRHADHTLVTEQRQSDQSYLQANAFSSEQLAEAQQDAFAVNPLDAVYEIVTFECAGKEEADISAVIDKSLLLGLPCEVVIEALEIWEHLSVMSINRDHSMVKLLCVIDVNRLE